MDTIDTPLNHYDTTVFPDDLQWYSLFERHVLSDTIDTIIVQAKGKDSESSIVFPLVRTSSKTRGITLASMQNYYSVDYRPLCSTSDARALIAPTLLELIRTETPDIIHLQPLDSDAPETALIKKALEELSWPAYTAGCQVNWVHDFTGSYADYIRSRPGKLRSTLKRRTAKLMALEEVSISVNDGNANLDELLQAYQTIYDRSWKVPEPNDQFIPALIATMAARGQLRLGLLCIGQRPVAVHFWIVKQGHAYIYKLAHDGKFDAFSPGTVLMARMIKHVMENDEVTRLDFMSGDDQYKQDWMSERREKLSLLAYNPRSLRGRLAHTVDRQLIPLVRRITRRPGTGKLLHSSADRLIPAGAARQLNCATISGT